MGPFSSWLGLITDIFVLSSNHCCCLFSALLMRISGQGTSNPYFQNTNIIFKKDPTFAFDILEFVILTFAQFFSPISENTSPSLRFLVLHFQQSHISYCRQKSKICSNKEIHQSLIFIIRGQTSLMEYLDGLLFEKYEYILSMGSCLK